MRSLIVSLMLIVLFTACSEMGNASYAPERADYAAESGMADYEEEQGIVEESKAIPSVAAITEKDLVPSPRVLLRRAECRLEVVEVEQKVKRAERLTERYGGYLSQMDWQNGGRRKTANLTLRVPARYFSVLLDSLNQLAKKVEYQHVTAQDVTEEYVDLQTRLEAKKEVRDRYVAILRNRAKTVEEVLLAEEKIRRLQEEIEAQEGRLRLLEDRAALSVITLEMYEIMAEEDVVAAAWYTDFLHNAGDQLGAGGQAVLGLILGLLGIWPLLLLAGLLYWRRKWLRAQLAFRRMKSE